MPGRTRTPKATKEAVLREYRHKCSVCGTDRPQLHHIDENPRNNDPQNLLPLCPNCHLSDQHNPTSKHHPTKLLLFRTYKDPAILEPQFQALFNRMSFIQPSIEGLGPSEYAHYLEDLVTFVSACEMGTYYGPRIEALLGMVVPLEPLTFAMREFAQKNPGKSIAAPGVFDRHFKQCAAEWRSRQEEVLNKHGAEAVRLIVESLRFQRWRR